MCQFFFRSWQFIRHLWPRPPNPKTGQSGVAPCEVYAIVPREQDSYHIIAAREFVDGSRTRASSRHALRLPHGEHDLAPVVGDVRIPPPPPSARCDSRSCAGSHENVLDFGRSPKSDLCSAIAIVGGVRVAKPASARPGCVVENGGVLKNVVGQKRGCGAVGRGRREPCQNLGNDLPHLNRAVCSRRAV